MKKYTNKEDGVEAQITKIDSGFSVRLLDIEANEFSLTIRIYKTELQAIEYAKSLVK